MFAYIETNGASHIIIHIPHEGADKSLPALAQMLEKNALFVQGGYRDFDIKTPTMGVVLGNKFKATYGDTELEIQTPAESVVLSEGFQIASPAVVISNAKALEKSRSECSQLRTEVEYLKKSLERAQEQVKALTEVEAD